MTKGESPVGLTIRDCREFQMSLCCAEEGYLVLRFTKTVAMVNRAIMKARRRESERGTLSGATIEITNYEG